MLFLRNFVYVVQLREQPKNQQNMEDDLMNAFFSFEDPPVAFVQAKPQIRVEIKPEEKEIIDIKREDKGVEYSRRHIIKEEQLLATQTLNQPSTSSAIKPDPDPDDDEDQDPIETKNEDPELPELEVFQHYEFNLNPQQLPILNERENILAQIDRSYVVVLTANTGTGKSSQVPQYILEEAFKRNEKCNIIVTQPRRIAAITIARRVALERRCECGTLVGYQIGLDKQVDMRMNSDTRILFCTTGVLLQKLIKEKSMKRYTHVILDEVHERDVEMDMLLIIVRRLLATRNPHVKIVLMSATLNANKIADFFKIYDKRGKYGPAPIMDLNIPRPYKVSYTYLDSLIHLGASNDMVNIEKPGISNKMYSLALKAMEHVLQKAKGKFSPSFLVFLPGIQEIRRFENKLYEPSKILNISDFQLSVLHSSIPEENLAKAFDGSVDNKIILATNIAESSVTLPGVRFVIDFCLTKYQQTDTATNMSQLTLDWASKMSLEQRAGRVGRIEAGQVVRLLFEHQFNDLPMETVPEMQRVSLESVVLQAKRLDLGKPSDILALALDPPSRSAIVDSILVLKEIGGLTRLSKRGKFNENDGELTFAGNVMALLPVDVRISKLIMLGYMFSCMEECIIIGAGMATRNIFKNNRMKKMEEYHQKLEQAAGSGSDLIAILNAYREWSAAVSEKGLKGRIENQWCELKMLSLKNLNEMNVLIGEIKNRLKFLHLEDNYRFQADEKLLAIKVCIAGAFYPNYFAFGGTPPSRDDCKTLKNMNPCTTVFLKGMKLNRIGQIYEQQVRQKLNNEGITNSFNEMRVTFDDHAARLYVDFKPICDDDIQLVPGEVLSEVYKAVKLRMSQKGMELNIMSEKNEAIFASEIGLGHWKSGKFEMKKKFLRASDLSIYPTNIQDEEINGQVTHIVNCGKFFFQPDKGRLNIKKQQEIYQPVCKNIDSLDDALNGLLLLVMHDQGLKRGKILEKPDEAMEEEEYTVFLVDYGSTVKAVFTDFYACDGESIRERRENLDYIFELPPQCFQCRLSEVIPSPIKCPSGWSKKCTEVFEDFIRNKKVKLTVNSFVDRVASVILFTLCPTTGASERLNEELVLRNFAQTSDDSYMCLLNQNNRETERKSKRKQPLEDELADENIIPPPDDLLVEELTIDGPYSPLECKVESLSRTRMSDIVTEASSVNHVLFDPYPNDAVKKLLVAATMSKREQRVTLHQSTIMPHLTGMACLLGLMFSPMSEVRLSNKRSRYTSILTGLGCDSNRKPHYAEHDCLIYVDVTLDGEDFDMIDKLRSKMSYLMQSQTGVKFEPQKHQKEIARNQACSLLMQIMKKPRNQLGINMEGGEWNWKTFVKIEQKVEAMYPALVTAEKLSPLSENTRRDLRNHANELDQLAAVNSKDEIIFCQLCEERVETVMDLKLHVMKKLHKERKVRIREEPM